MTRAIQSGIIHAFSLPATKKQVRAFLGITGYYRKFITNYSALAAPLSDLTKKNQLHDQDRHTQPCQAGISVASP